MARIFASGYELNSTTAGVEFTGKQGTPTITTTHPLSGTYEMRSQGGAVNSFEQKLASADGNGPYYVRTWIYLVTSASARAGILYLGNGSGTQKGAIALETDDTLKLYATTVNIGSPSAVLAKNVWHCIELYLFNNTVSGKMELTGKLNGTTFATSTTATETGTFSFVRTGYQGAGGSTVDIYYDDLEVSDSAFPGFGNLMILRPDANGQTQNGSRGGSDSGSNFGQVDEVTPNDVTDYWIVAANNDIFEVGLSAASGTIDANATTNAVYVGARMSGAGAATSHAGKLRIKTQNSGTLAESASIVETTTSWYTHSLTAPSNYKIVQTTDPQGGGAWTPTLLDAIQIGYQVTDANPDVNITALWAYVSFQRTTKKTTTGKARIALITSKTQAGKARITATTTKTTTGKARIQKAATQTTAGKARITSTTTKTQSGKAAIAVTTTKTQAGKARIAATTTQTQQGKANVAVPTAQTQSGKARITAATSQAQTGKARITATTTKTQSGKSRIQTTASQTQAGKARVTASTTKTTTGKARITATSSQTQQGKARIQVSTTKTQQGLARVTATATKTQQGKARVTATTTQTQQGKSRVTATTTKTQAGKSRVQVSTSKTQTGKANIESGEDTVTPQTITGKARITKSASQTQLGKGRVTATASKTQAGKARIAVVTSKTEQGKARITATSSRTQSGKSRIAITSSATRTGVARITSTTSKVSQGKARVAKTTTKTISGIAAITDISTITKNLTGVARIVPDTRSSQEVLVNLSDQTVYVGMSKDNISSMLGTSERQTNMAEDTETSVNLNNPEVIVELEGNA